MTTTKTAEKPQPPQRQTAAPSGEEMQLVYQCHTLARILYGHIAITYPWLVQGQLLPQYQGFQQPLTGLSAAAWTPPWTEIPRTSFG